MTPYQRIMRAAYRGVGVRLSATDVQSLSHEDAIAMTAREDDEACPECGRTCDRSRKRQGNRCCNCADRLYGETEAGPCDDCRHGDARVARFEVKL
jgi:hypothetical protein